MAISLKRMRKITVNGELFSGKSARKCHTMKRDIVDRYQNYQEDPMIAGNDDPEVFFRKLGVVRY